ncbi:hypothetical protein [Aliidiomarina sp.]|uniref:hypothetical protein n=1 Tax=Aliidiomarina sp. TaxID=1872439 RepID=UPI003A4DFA38
MKTRAVLSAVFFLQYFFLASLFSDASASTTETVECVELSPLSSVVVDIENENDFFNCFNSDEIPHGNEVIFNVVSTDQNYPFKVVIYDMSSGTAVEINELSSPNGGTISYQTTMQTSDIGFRIEPYSSVNEDVRLTIGFGITENDGGIFFINLDSVPKEEEKGGGTSPPLPPGETCDPVTNICFEIQSLPTSSTSTQQEILSSSCSDFEATGAPESLDINKALNKIKQDTENLNVFQKASYFIVNFNRNRVYDFAFNADYPDATEEFGNWFYGAAMNVAGYTNQQARRYAATMQPVQNIPDNASWYTKADGQRQAISNFITGNGDDPDDVGDINKGYQYANVFANDIQMGVSGNSCDTSSQPTSTGGGGSPGGWIGRLVSTMGSWGFQFCNACRTSITDLPSENVSDPAPETDPN